MKLPMQNLNSIFASNIQHMDDNEIDDLKNVPMSAVINTETAFLAFRSPWDRDYPNRPYLHILGSLQQLNGTLPYDITGIYTQHNTTRVDAFYEFTNDQLSDLVKKGLYERGFEVPEQIKESQLEVDVNCNFKIIKPDKARNVDFPIVFAQVNNLRNLQLTQENSGYDLAEYFEKAKTLDHSYHEANNYQITANLPEIDKSKQTEPAPKLPKDDMLDFTDHSLDLDDGITADAPELNEQPESLATDASDLVAGEHDESMSTDHDIKENKMTSQDPNPVPFNKPEKSDANDLIKKARERIAKRKAKIAQEQNKLKKQKTEKKKQQQTPVDTEHTDNEYRNSVRVNQVNNEQAELQNKGILQETIPETASDFDNINDEKLDKTVKKSKKHAPNKMNPIKAPSVNPKSVDDDYTL